MAAVLPALPSEVRDLATRLGAMEADGPSSVVLAQRGCMRDRPGTRAMRFHARETISLSLTAFEWRASAGPFGSMSVLDALNDGQARLEVRLFRYLPLAAIAGGAAPVKGQIMRYLAELAWAPDAILRNPSLAWTVVDDHMLRVSAGNGDVRGAVALHLDKDGRIAGISAEDRPRKEASGFVERPWRGRFFDFHRHEGRWLPFRGEVGWIVDGQPFTAWRGELVRWSMA